MDNLPYDIIILITKSVCENCDDCDFKAWSRVSKRIRNIIETVSPNIWLSYFLIETANIGDGYSYFLHSSERTLHCSWIELDNYTIRYEIVYPRIAIDCETPLDNSVEYIVYPYPNSLESCVETLSSTDPKVISFWKIYNERTSRGKNRYSP